MGDFDITPPSYFLINRMLDQQFRRILAGNPPLARSSGALSITESEWEHLKKMFPQRRADSPLSGALGDFSGLPIFVIAPKRGSGMIRYRRHPCNKRARIKQRRRF